MKKIVLFAVAGLALTGCGLSQSKFEDQSAEKGCEISKLCDLECADGGGDDSGAAECDYDKAAAQDCLDAMDALIDAGECPDADGFATLAVCADVCG